VNDESSPDDLDLQPMNTGRYRPVIIGIIVLAIGVGVALAVTRKFNAADRGTQLRVAATAWNAFQRCLIGSYEPHGESIAARVRRIEIGIPISQRHPDLVQHGTAWPFRCAGYATRITHAIFESHSEESNHRLLMALASRAATALDEGELRTGRNQRLSYIDELFEVARRAALPPGEPARNSVPPEPGNPLTPRAMTPLFQGVDAAQFLAQDPQPGRALHVAVGGAHRRLCESFPGTDAARALTTMRCTELDAIPAGVPVAVPPVADDIAGWVFGTPNAQGQFALYRLGVTQPLRTGDVAEWIDGPRDAPRVVSLVSGPAPVAPGARPRGGEDEVRWRIVRTLVTQRPPPRTDGGTNAPVEIDLALPEPASLDVLHPTIVGGFVFVAHAAPASAGAGGGGGGDGGGIDVADGATDAAIDTAADGVRGDASAADADGSFGDGASAPAAPLGGPATLYARTLEGDASARFERVGTLQDVARGASAESCRTQETTAIAIRSRDSVHVVFSTNGAWSAPVHADIPPATLTCHGREIAFTWTETTPRRLIHQTRCTVTGCQTSQGPFPEFESPPMVTDLAGRVLILHTAGGSGVRMRLAPLARIASSDDVFIVDDDRHGGLATQPLSPIFVRDGVAIVFATSRADPNDVYALRIAADGTFSAVRPAARLE